MPTLFFTLFYISIVYVFHLSLSWTIFQSGTPPPPPPTQCICGRVPDKPIHSPGRAGWSCALGRPTPAPVTLDCGKRQVRTDSDLSHAPTNPGHQSPDSDWLADTHTNSESSWVTEQVKKWGERTLRLRHWSKPKGKKTTTAINYLID